MRHSSRGRREGNIAPHIPYNFISANSFRHFIKDKRYDDGSGVIDAHQVEYVCYEDGIKLLIDPVNEMGKFPGAE